jgi:hypothetical protein
VFEFVDVLPKKATGEIKRAGLRGGFDANGILFVVVFL